MASEPLSPSDLLPASASAASATRRATFDPLQVPPSASSTHHSSRRHSLYGTEDRIVIDPGSRIWKVGFSGEARPRAVFPSYKPMSTLEPRDEGRTALWELDMPGGKDEREELERALYERMKDRLRAVFFQHLMVDPKSRKVIIAENPLLPICVKDMFARILFRNLHVPSLSFAPAGLLALLAAGRTTGLAVDIGHHESTVLPIYMGRPLYPLLRCTPIASARLTAHLRDLILLFGGYYPPGTPGQTTAHAETSVPREVLTDSVLDDIKTRFCIVDSPLPPPSAPSSPSSEPPESHPSPLHALRTMYAARPSTAHLPPLPYPLQNRGTLLLPAWLRARAAEVLFAPGDVDEACLTELVLDCFSAMGADLRQVFVGRILLIGGGAAMRGVGKRLVREMEMCVEGEGPGGRERDRWRDVRHLRGRFALVNGADPEAKVEGGKAPAWKPGSMVWVGGSLAGALKLTGHEIVRERYDEADAEAASRAAGEEDGEEVGADAMDVDEAGEVEWRGAYMVPDWTRLAQQGQSAAGVPIRAGA